MRYRSFGPTGLRVSELFPGAMTFGEQGGVGAPPEECARILDTCAEARGNVVDTARELPIPLQGDPHEPRAKSCSVDSCRGSWPLSSSSPAALSY